MVVHSGCTIYIPTINFWRLQFPLEGFKMGMA